MNEMIVFPSTSDRMMSAFMEEPAETVSLLTLDIKRFAFNPLNGNPLLDAEKAALSRCISQKLSWYVSFPVGSYKKS